MTPDPLDLDAVEALCGAATTGPWSVRPIHFDNWGIIRSAMGNLVAVARAGDTSYRDRDHRLAGTDPFEHNAQFIAAARTLVPALVTRLRAAEAEVVRLRAVETWLRGGKDGPSCFDRWICTPNGQEGPVVARHYEAPADLEAPTLAELGAKLADAARTAGA